MVGGTRGRPADTGNAQSSSAAGSGGTERVTVNLSPRAARALETATALTGETKTDAINRALQIYAFLEQVTDQGGSIYTKEGPDANLDRVRLF
jgi:hypothetical protein